MPLVSFGDADQLGVKQSFPLANIPIVLKHDIVPYFVQDLIVRAKSDMNSPQSREE